MSPEITPIPLHAAAPLALMHRACFPEDPWDKAAMERVLALSGGFGYLAWQGKVPSGFVLARDLGDEIEILSLGVLPRWRRSGIGRRLLDRVIAKGGERNIDSIVLEVATENTAALRLYLSCGFVQVGRRPRYYQRAGSRADALILRRRDIVDVQAG